MHKQTLYCQWNNKKLEKEMNIVHTYFKEIMNKKRKKKSNYLSIITIVIQDNDN